MKIEDAIRILNKYIESQQAILCIQLQYQGKLVLYPISEIKKIGRYISTQHMFISTESVHNEDYVNGYSIPIEGEIEFKQLPVNPSKTIFTYGRNKFILFK